MAFRPPSGGGGGSGDVTGPGSSTDNALVRFNGTTGKIIQDNSNFTQDDAGLGNYTAAMADILANTSGLTLTTTSTNTNPVGNSLSHVALSFTMSAADDFDYTSTQGAVIGIAGVVQSLGATNTVASMYGLVAFADIGGAGTVTEYSGMQIAYFGFGGGTLDKHYALKLDGSVGGTTATESWVLDYDPTEYSSNNRALKITGDGGTTNEYLPISTADTGLTFDSDNLVFATTTFGDIQLNPAGVVVATKSGATTSESLINSSVTSGGVGAGQIIGCYQGSLTGNAGDSSNGILGYYTAAESVTTDSIVALLGGLVTQQGNGDLAILTGQFTCAGTGSFDGVGGIFVHTGGTGTFNGVTLDMTNDTNPVGGMVGVKAILRPDIAGIPSVVGIAISNEGSEGADDGVSIGVGTFVDGIDFSTATTTNDIRLSSGLIINDSANITLTTTTSGNIVLNPATVTDFVDINGYIEAGSSSILLSGNKNAYDFALSAEPTNNSSATFRGLTSVVTSSGGNNFNSTTALTGAIGQAVHDGTLTVTGASAQANTVSNLNTGTITKATGASYSILNINAGGTITEGVGASYVHESVGGGTFTKYSALELNNASTTAAASVYFAKLDASSDYKSGEALVVDDGGTDKYISLMPVTGGIYGGISAYEVGSTVTITGSGIGNKVQVTAFDTDDPANGATPDHTNDHITVTEPGKYMVTISIAMESAGGTAYVLSSGLWKNNGATQFQNVHTSRRLSGGGSDTGSATLSGIVDVADNDTLELWVWNETNTNNVIIDDVTFSIIYLGA